MNKLLNNQSGHTDFSQMIEMRKRIVNSWMESGLLDGNFTGEKINVAQLYESKAAVLLNESNLEFYIGQAAQYLNDKNYMGQAEHFIILLKK